MLAAAAVAVAMLLTGTAALAAPRVDDPLPSASDAMVSPLIVGGQPASRTYQGLGSLQYERNGDPDWHTCAVNLWDPWHAVTNAHCVTVYPTGELKDPVIYHIRWNTSDRQSGGVVTGVKKLAVHELWDWSAPGGPEADIAVLWLDKPVFTVPSALPPVAGRWPVRPGPARTVGWGYTYYPWDQPATPRHLAELDTRIVDPSHCAAANIDAAEVCVMADDPAAAPCFGDSGGPVMTPTRLRDRWYLIGTVLRETDTACAGAVVYTSVVAYAGWIGQTIAAGHAKPRRPAPAGPLPAYRWAGCGTTC